MTGFSTRRRARRLRRRSDRAASAKPPRHEAIGGSAPIETVDESTCPLNSVVGFVNPRGLDPRFLPGPTPFSEPVRAETLYVSGRPPLEQRFNEQLANATRA